MQRIRCERCGAESEGGIWLCGDCFSNLKRSFEEAIALCDYLLGVVSLGPARVHEIEKKKEGIKKGFYSFEGDKVES